MDSKENRHPAGIEARRVDSSGDGQYGDAGRYSFTRPTSSLSTGKNLPCFAHSVNVAPTAVKRFPAPLDIAAAAGSEMAREGRIPCASMVDPADSPTGDRDASSLVVPGANASTVSPTRSVGLVTTYARAITIGGGGGSSAGGCKAVHIRNNAGSRLKHLKPAMRARQQLGNGCGALPIPCTLTRTPKGDGSDSQGEAQSCQGQLAAAVEEDRNVVGASRSFKSPSSHHLDGAVVTEMKTAILNPKAASFTTSPPRQSPRPEPGLTSNNMSGTGATPSAASRTSWSPFPTGLDTQFSVGAGGSEPSFLAGSQDSEVSEKLQSSFDASFGDVPPDEPKDGGVSTGPQMSSNQLTQAVLSDDPDLEQDAVAMGWDAASQGKEDAQNTTVHPAVTVMAPPPPMPPSVWLQEFGSENVYEEGFARCQSDYGKYPFYEYNVAYDYGVQQHLVGTSTGYVPYAPVFGGHLHATSPMALQPPPPPGPPPPSATMRYVETHHEHCHYHHHVLHHPSQYYHQLYLPPHLRGADRGGLDLVPGVERYGGHTYVGGSASVKRAEGVDEAAGEALQDAGEHRRDVGKVTGSEGGEGSRRRRRGGLPSAIRRRERRAAARAAASASAAAVARVEEVECHESKDDRMISGSVDDQGSLTSSEGC